MNVLHLVGTGRPGGVESWVADLLRLFGREKIGAVVGIIGDDGPMTSRFSEAGAEIVQLGDGRFQQAVTLARLLSRSGDRAIHVVHAHSGGRALRWTARLSSRAGILAHLHGMPAAWMEDRDDSKRSSERMKSVASGAHELAVSSHWMGEAARRAETKLRVNNIPYCVDSSRFSPAARSRYRAAARAELGIRDNARVLGFLGRMVEQKGPDRLLEVAELIQGATDVETVIVGSGPLEDAARKSAASRGLRRVHFPGGTTDPARAMSAFDVTIMTSLWEPFGIVAIESLAMGIPVVAFDVGGLGEAVMNNRDGLLVPAFDVAALAAAAQKLLFDPEMQREFGARGRERVARDFTPSESLLAVTECYRRLARSKS